MLLLNLENYICGTGFGNFCFEPQAWYDFLQQTAAKFWWASVLQMGQHMSTYSACPKWCKLNLPRQSDNQLSCHGVSCQSVCLANRETSRPRFLPIGHFLDWSLFCLPNPRHLSVVINEFYFTKLSLCCSVSHVPLVWGWLSNSSKYSYNQTLDNLSMN